MDKVTYVFLTLMAKIRSIMSDIADIRKSSAAGAPTKVTKASEMTDTDKNYLYLGTESGYNSGHIYYFVEGVLTDGGAYGGVNVDTTLTQSGQAADAKKTGDEIATVKEDLSVGLNSLALGNRLLIKKLVFADGYWNRDGGFTPSPTTFHTDKMEAVPGHKYYIEFPTTTPKITRRNFNADGTVNKSSDILTSGVFTSTTNIIAFNAVGNAKSDNIYLFDAETALASNKPYKDKTISIIGDSLSDKSNSTASTRYYDIVDQMLGTISTEYAMSGCGYKRKYNNGDAFYEQALQINSNTDLVLIFGSFNDHNVYDTDGLGAVTDTTTDTVFGCVYTTLQNIFATAPKALVGIILPTPWAQYPPYDTNTLQWEYVNGIKEIAKRYSIPVLDLYTESNMRPWDETFRVNYYRENGVQDNGTHPNSDGHKRFAPKVVEFVKSILESNT